MAVDLNKPVMTDTYSTFLDYVRDNIKAASSQGAGTAYAGTIPNYTVKWDSTNSKWVRYNSATSAWVDLTTSYDIKVKNIDLAGTARATGSFIVYNAGMNPPFSAFAFESGGTVVETVKSQAIGNKSFYGPSFKFTVGSSDTLSLFEVLNNATSGTTNRTCVTTNAGTENATDAILGLTKYGLITTKSYNAGTYLVLSSKGTTTTSAVIIAPGGSWSGDRFTPTGDGEFRIYGSATNYYNIKRSYGSSTGVNIELPYRACTIAPQLDSLSAAATSLTATSHCNKIVTITSGTTVTLPPVADCRSGDRIVLYNNTASTVSVAATGLVSGHTVSLAQYKTVTYIFNSVLSLWMRENTV